MKPAAQYQLSIQDVFMLASIPLTNSSQNKLVDLVPRPVYLASDMKLFGRSHANHLSKCCIKMLQSTRD